MKINILLPYKEKFDENKASSVSITVRNNLLYSKYSNQIKVFGQNVDNPICKNNFIGITHTLLSFQSKNRFLASKMIDTITKDPDKNQLIEIHNRPYLLKQIINKTNLPVNIFFHNDPLTMKGSKTVKERKNILDKCTAVFVVSEFIKMKFLQGINSNNKKIHVLHNGVNRELTKFPKKKKEILFVGRLVPEKGVHLYVDVVHNIAYKFPDWEFGIIGSFRLGENSIRENFVDKLINKFRKIGNQAKFYGFKNQNFVQDKMQTASIIVIPSLWEEPFGLVAAEAMSNGIAIIASDIGGIPEIVKNNGVLIKDINKSKLEHHLIDLINNNVKRNALQRLSWNNFENSSENSSEKLDTFREFIFKNWF